MRLFLVVLSILYISVIGYAQSRSSGSSGSGSGGSGTVTSIVTDGGMVPNTITTSGTLMVDVGITANKIVQLTSGAQLPAVDGFLLTNLNAGGSNAFIKNGNAFAGNVNIGLTDAFNLNVITSGTPRMTVTSAGIVGIGTTSPGGHLQVSTNAVSTAFSLVNTSTGGRDWRLISVGTGSVVGLTGSLGFFDSTLSLTRMVITDTGKVGIGTTTPFALLEVKGSAATAATASFSVKNSAGLQSIYVSDNGNVGIGTTVPVSQLDVTGGTIIGTIIRTPTLSSLGTNGLISIMVNNQTVAATAVTLTSGTTSNSSGIFKAVAITPTYNQTSTGGATDLLVNRVETVVGSGPQLLLDLQNSGTSKMVVSSTGNVGIGTTAPTALLHVSANAGSLAVGDGGNTAVYTTYAATRVQMGYDGAGATIDGLTKTVTLKNVNTGVGLALNTTGNLGFGGTISDTLTMQGSKMIVMATGAVGIGTTGPQALLDLVSTGTIGSIIVPRGTTAARSAAPVNGMIRYNSDNSKFEGYESGSWVNMTPTGSSAFVAGGNAFTSNVNIGLTDAFNLTVFTNNLPRMIVMANGFVGIGTTSPSAPFELISGQVMLMNLKNTSTASFAGFNAYDTPGVLAATVAYANSGTAVFPNSLWISSRKSGEAIVFSAGGATESVRFASGGNVGIGNTLPASRLHQDSGNATATTHKFTAGTTTGVTATDGFDIGVDASGNATINQFESLDMIFSTNNTEALRIEQLGNITLPHTNTTGGTTGNQTINKISGTVNIAAAGTSVVVTNSFVSTTSIILTNTRTNDATCSVKNVVPAAGSFTLTTTAACTAETSFGFFVIN